MDPVIPRFLRFAIKPHKQTNAEGLRVLPRISRNTVSGTVSGSRSRV